MSDFMTWTTEIPVEDGFYWYYWRRSYDVHPYHREGYNLIRVVGSGVEFLGSEVGEKSPDFFVSQDADCAFYGPLPVSIEPPPCSLFGKKT